MDGFELDLPATPGNLAVFSCTGVSKDTQWDGEAGKSQAATVTPGGPFPHLRCLLITACAGRAMLGAAADATDAGEQSLVARLVREHPELFAGRVFLMDRNFRAPRGALAYRPRSGHGLEEVSVGLMAYLDP